MSDQLQDRIDRPVSRRQFLKYAAAAGAAVGAAGGLGGLLAACGTQAATTTSAAPVTTAAATTSTAAATTTSAAPTTTAAVATTAEGGRDVKVGVITPLTGMFAAFAVADKWSMAMWKEHQGESLVMGDGKSHKIVFVQKDTQSDSNRASQIASDMIMNDNVDIIVVGGGPDTAMPAATQAETLGRPLLACNVPWEAFILGRGGTMDKAFKWTFVHSFGVEQGAKCAVEVFDKVQTNKKAGLFLANTADTEAWLTPGIGAKDQLEAAGYTTVMPGRFNLGQEDYTAMISAYRKEGCDVIFSSNPGTDFPNFWQQALQQGYRPKVVIENALQDYAAIKALASAGLGLIQSNTWHKSWPFKDPISGLADGELAADYEARYKTKWDVYMSHYSRFGWAFDVLKRTKNPDDKESYLEAINTTKMQCITGDIDMTAKAGDMFSLHPHPNAVKTAWSQSQIVPNDKWAFDLKMIAIVDGPGVKTEGDPQPLNYDWMK